MGQTVLAWSHGVGFDPATLATWAVAGSPVAERFGVGVAATEHQVVIWGGDGLQDAGTSRAADLQGGAAYDPAADTWTSFTRAPLADGGRPVAGWTAARC